MRVLFLQRQPCIRALKYAVALRACDAGVRLSFAYQGRTLSAAYGAGDELFDEWAPLNGNAVASVRATCDRVRPDLVHSHNLPDELTVAALEALEGRVPVIHDVHDLQSLRATPYEDGFPEPADPPALERRAIEGSAALITVSDRLVAEIEARHRPPPERLVFANYALRRDLPPTLPPAGRPAGPRPRIVYQGSLSANGGHYDLRDTFRRLVAGGAALDVYSAGSHPEYRALAAAEPWMTYHEPISPPELMRELPRYDFGWAGFNDRLNGPHLDTALPNKAFEYVACGLPVLTLGHRALADLVAEEGIGIVLEDPDDLAHRLAGVDLEPLRATVAGARERFTVEGNIARVTDLYRRVAAG